MDHPQVARVRRRWPLRYRLGPDADQDRPSHVRAGSGLAVWHGQLAVVQDDALFVGLVDLAQLGDSPPAVEALALPRGQDGARHFGGDRPNKRHKPDLEAAVALPDGRLLLVGSGSTPVRQTWYLVDPPGDHGGVALLDARDVYDKIRALPGALTAELNLEGAALWRDRLWLAQRSNGSPLGPQGREDALISADLADVLAWIDGCSPVPELRLERNLTLGQLDGVRLTLTDLCGGGDRLWWLAAAEDSPDAYNDGAVLGSVIGWLDDAGLHQLPLLDEAGEPLRSKCEGLAVDPRDDRRLWAVVDCDNAAIAVELLEILLA